MIEGHNGDYLCTFFGAYLLPRDCLHKSVIIHHCTGMFGIGKALKNSASGVPEVY